MVNACTDPDFFVRGGGGGCPSSTARKQLDFFMFVLGFFSPKFSGDAGVQLFTGGGGPNANFYRI